MNRRGFLSACLAAAAAPYVVRSGILMPVGRLYTPPTTLEIVERALAHMRAVGIAPTKVIIPRHLVNFAQILIPGCEKIFEEDTKLHPSLAGVDFRHAVVGEAESPLPGDRPWLESAQIFRDPHQAR